MIARGMHRMMTESAILITDYVAVGGIGAAFVNAGLLMLISLGLLFYLKVDMGGISVASVFLMGGFALFGKNLCNIWPIIFGVYLYAKVRKESFKNHVHTSFLATGIAPIVTEFLFVMDMPLWIRVLSSMTVGISIGFLITPLALNVAKLHRGFNLYNIGFSVGILGTVYVSVLKSYGYTAYSRLIWSTGNSELLGIFLCGLFIAMIAAGLVLDKHAGRRLCEIFKRSGIAGSDFIALAGFEAVLINMGINGMVAMAYIVLVSGELNGPTVGGILTVAGFGAWGKHIKNMIPILTGVFLGGLTKIWNVNDPALLIAALFGTALAPIAGYFGWVWGVVAGFINSSVVLNSGILHGGMNLYNTGFSAGIVAAVLVPLLNTFHTNGLQEDP